MEEDWPWVAAAMAANGNSSLLARWLVAARQVATIRNQCPAAVLGQRFWPGLQEVPAQVMARYQQILADHSLQTQWNDLRRQGWQLLLDTATTWPVSLRGLPDMPAVLFVQGNVEQLQQPAIAMVGARQASLEGRQIAKTFAAQLATSGLLVVSGLALGIDGAAHEGAAPSGNTIAVLGQGPGTPLYPSRHRRLAEQILDKGGALITEFPPWQTPRREFFPQRNRLISGLAQAVIVVEAAMQSGSLITARLAADQGREVFAVPGSIRNPMSRGCHQLLKDGAHWLEELTDVVSVLKQDLFLPPSQDKQASHPLLACFVSGVNTVEQLQQHSGLLLTDVLIQLSDLELEGAVEKMSGGYCRR